LIVEVICPDAACNPQSHQRFNATKQSNVSFFHVSFMAAASAVMREPVVLAVDSINL
jgi:hypothetical protein